MATVPLSGTNIRFLSDIPFSNDYKHTRWFDTLNDQTNYFLNKPVIHSMTQANFQRIEGKNFISTNKSIDELWGTNYVMFQNAQYNNKWFYAFVTKLEYVQKNTTYVHFQIDVFQTWKFQMNFKPSYVVREHCPLWNDDGSPVINTVDEGLDYGLEYDTVYLQNHQLNLGYKWLVILSKTPLHDGNANKVLPNVVGTPQPLSVYLVPFKDDNTVPAIYVDGSPQAELISSPTRVLSAMYVAETSVNNVVSIFVTDYIGIPSSCTAGNPDLITFDPDHATLSFATIGDPINDGVRFMKVDKVEDFLPMYYDYGFKYDGYKTVKESKLLMYPYTQLVLDDFKGNRVNYKNEYINNSNLWIISKGSLGTSNKTSYAIRNYNNTKESSIDDPVTNEHAIINNDPNDVPVINDLLSAFLQGNRNTLANQKNAIVFNATTDIVNNAFAGVASAISLNGLGLVSSQMGQIQTVGNAYYQIQAQTAKKQDIANTPPQLAKMGGNTAYTFGNNYNGVFIIKKQIKDEYIRKLEHFFNMFGYKLNEIKMPNFHTRKYWNYVQTISCVITGNFNNEDLQELKNVFDNGITLWHTDDIGNYSLANEVI